MRQVQIVKVKRPVKQDEPDLRTPAGRVLPY